MENFEKNAVENNEESQESQESQESVEKTDPVMEFLGSNLTIAEKDVSINGEIYKAKVSKEIMEDDNGEIIRKVFTVEDETGRDIKSSDVSPVAKLDKDTGKWTFNNSSF